MAPRSVALHSGLEEIFTDFEHAGIRWAMLRDPLDLSVPPGDIDLLVDRSEASDLHLIAEKRSFVRVPRSGPDMHLVAYHSGTDLWLWLHIVDRIRLGPCGLLQPGGEDAMLDRRRMNGPVSRLAPPDAFWALLLHELLDRGRVRVERRDQLAGLVEFADRPGPLLDAVTRAAPPGWDPRRFADSVRAQSWGELEHMAPELSAAWAEDIGLTGRRLRTCRTRRRLEVVRQAWSRRGLTIAVLGPDGAGKSSLVEGLTSGFAFPVKRIYMGLTGGVLPRVSRMRVPVFMQLGHLLVFWGRYLRGQYRKARGHLVVFERYVFDAVAPHPRPQGPFGRAVRWMYGQSCPAPDVTIILDVPGAEMHRRAGEYTPAMLEEWRRCFLSLEGRVRGVEVVDGTRDARTVRADVTNRIWDRYRHRWSSGSSPRRGS